VLQPVWDPGVLVRVAVGPTTVLVRVGVRLAVFVGPTAVLVRVRVRVAVGTGPEGVFVLVTVRTPTVGVLVFVAVGAPPAISCHSAGVLIGSQVVMEVCP
jgi:hypothetical protein